MVVFRNYNVAISIHNFLAVSVDIFHIVNKFSSDHVEWSETMNKLNILTVTTNYNYNVLQFNTFDKF